MVRVSIIIPCRNERDYIARCLDSIIGNGYPREDLEVLVIDGMSDDGTRDVLRAYATRYPFIRVLDNPRRIIPAALNTGIRNARGEIVMRMDAHTEYGDGYVARCVRYLAATGADNVGGLWVTRPGAGTRTARAIALAMSHPFGVGNARYRTGVRGPEYVDTVPFGCYRKDVFARIGYYDEDLVRNEDDELNLRLLRQGGRILLAPDIVSYYYARPTYAKAARMFYQYGFFKPLVVRKVKAVMTLRQVVPALFVFMLGALGLLSLADARFLWLLALAGGTYLAGNAACSLSLALKHDALLFPHLVAAFAAVHGGYGAGYLRGICRFILAGKVVFSHPERYPLTR